MPPKRASTRVASGRVSKRKATGPRKKARIPPWQLDTQSQSSQTLQPRLQPPANKYLTAAPETAAKTRRNYPGDGVILSEFTCFQKLPPELRIKIWKYAAFQPRWIIIGTKGSHHQNMHNSAYFLHLFYPSRQVPSLLQANKESRAEGLTVYKFVFDDDHSSTRSWDLVFRGLGLWPILQPPLQGLTVQLSIGTPIYINWATDILVFRNLGLTTCYEPIREYVAAKIKAGNLQNLAIDVSHIPRTLHWPGIAAIRSVDTQCMDLYMGHQNIAAIVLFQRIAPPSGEESVDHRTPILGDLSMNHPKQRIIHRLADDLWAAIVEQAAKESPHVDPLELIKLIPTRIRLCELDYEPESG